MGKQQFHQNRHHLCWQRMQLGWMRLMPCVSSCSHMQENIRRNFGMPQPNGYRKAMRFMRHANKFGLPIVTFVDTPGAYAGRTAEELGQVRNSSLGVVRGLSSMQAVFNSRGLACCKLGRLILQSPLIQYMLARVCWLGLLTPGYGSSAVAGAVLLV